MNCKILLFISEIFSRFSCSISKYFTIFAFAFKLKVRCKFTKKNWIVKIYK